jgi:thiol-disulfide isomerase/thioredoxin
MKKFLLTIAIVLCIGIEGVYAQQAVQYIPNKVISGEETTLIYNNSKTNLSGKESVEGVIYLWKDYKWEAQDLKLVKNDTAWVAKFRTPVGCALICPVFTSGDITDKGGKNTYASFTMNSKGENIPSSYIGWGMLRNMKLSNHGIPQFCDSLNAIGDDVMRFWINQELRFFPQSQADILPYVVELFSGTGYGDEKLKEKVKEGIDFVLESSNPSEKQLMGALEVCNNFVSDVNKSKEIESQILSRYPNGILARDAEIRRISKITEASQKEIEFERFLQRFPPKNFEGVETTRTKQYNDLFRAVIYNRVMNNDYSALYKYMQISPYSMLVTYAWHLVQIPYNNKEKSSQILKPHADAIIKEIFDRPRTGNDLILSPSQWNKQKYANLKDALLVYAKILYETGYSDKALELAEQIKNEFNYKSAEFNEFYAQILAKEGFTALVVPSIELSIKENAATPEMLETLRKDYTARKGSDEGFDAYVESLKSKDIVDRQKEELKASLVREKIDLFTLEGPDGKKVDMSKLKGKIIVLDFWATWCTPCKAAMPGMQMAVNKYKDDKDVVFFFIATMEQRNDFREAISKFMKEKNYTLEVLYDNINAKTGERDAVYDNYGKRFHFSGIPHKMIIDGNGYLRWHSTGYYGSPTALADEIGSIIEMIKSGK